MTHTRPFPLPRPWFIRSQSTLRHLVAVGVLLSLFLPWSVILQPPRVGAQSSQGPSAFCHTTDGTFTDCDPQTTGREEWSDVQPSAFAAANSFLYVNQNAAKSALFLMYDFPFRTAPLASSQAVRISFDTVEQEPEGAALERYDVDIFGDGHMAVSVFGEPEPPNGIIGAVGFGPSPNSNVPHLMAELQVPLIPGGATVYSPDPLFWSASVPPPPPPPKQGRFTQQQKEALAKAADDLNIDSRIGLAIALACTLVPELSTKICTITIGLPSALIGILASLLTKLSHDPSDPNFTVIPIPVTPTLSQQPITPGDGITQQEADALNALFNNLEQSIGLSRALQTSIDRAQGAREAGDAFWEGQQLAAGKTFAGQLATLLDQQPNLLADLASALHAANVQISFSPESVADFQKLVELNGFPAYLTQAFLELGVDSTSQDEIKQAFLSANSIDVTNVGGGHFPDSLTDPALADALHQLATSLTLFSQPPASSLNPSLNVIIAGDYTAAGVGLRDRTQGTISLSSVPAEAHVVQAVLYWGMLDNGESQSLKNLNFNGTPLIGTRIAIGPDTCWGRTASFAFRADVTPLVSGNGSYNLTGVASGGNILAQGASLVVFYEKLGAPLKNVILLDGNVVLPFQTVNATSAFSGFLPANPAWAKTTFVVGDGQTFASETAAFTGSNGTNFFDSPFEGSDGPLWDTDTFDVSAQVGPSSGSSSAGISIGGDCLMWVAQVFSITTNPSENVQDVRATAAVVEANEDGTTTVGPTGLFPINEPSLAERVFLIVKDRIEENPGTSAAELTKQLVDSLVEGGLLPPEDAEKLIEEVLQRLFIPVNIDIKPGGFPNSINLGSNGNIPVAILSTATFNAPSLVNRATLTFGRTGDEHSLLRSSIEDVNKDGRPDVVCHFDTKLAAFQAGDTVGVLKGLTNTGQPIRGTDSIRIVPPK